MSSTFIKTIVLPVALTLVAFFFAYQFVDPAPPEKIILATGQQQGAYYNFGRQYQQYMAQHGIELEILETRGSIDNIDKLTDEKAHVAFVQGGTASESQNEDILALGSLYYEPLWVFSQKGLKLNNFKQLDGKRVYIGKPGSGTRALVNHLLNENQIEDKVKLVENIDADYELALRNDELDVVFMVASARSPAVAALLENPSIELMSFSRAEAYQRRFKFLQNVTMPRGMVNLSKDIPIESKQLLAPTANLVVSKDLHPAIQDLLLQAMDEVHGRGDWFEENGEFPNANFVEYPLSKEAKRFYKYGPPFLQRFLPFRLASLIDRLKVMLLPLIVLMLPLMKIMPPIYTWRMRSKIYRWYQALEKIDLANAKPDPDLEALRKQLEAIDQEVIHVHVPLSFASQLYDLRQHIELVKRRLS